MSISLLIQLNVGLTQVSTFTRTSANVTSFPHCKHYLVTSTTRDPGDVGTRSSIPRVCTSVSSAQAKDRRSVLLEYPCYMKMIFVHWRIVSLIFSHGLLASPRRDEVLGIIHNLPVIIIVDCYKERDQVGRLYVTVVVVVVVSCSSTCRRYDMSTKPPLWLYQSASLRVSI